MCAKLNRALAKFVPESQTKEVLRSLYYQWYYNKKHFKENDFRIYYKKGHFEYEFEEGIIFRCYDNIADELKRSLRGYLGKYKLREGDVVIDCGAYVGEFTLYAAKAVGSSGKVVAFEPDFMAYKKLVNNVNLNKLNNVLLVNKGVWSKNLILKLGSKGQQGNTFLCDVGDDRLVDTPVVSLDSELEEIGIKKVNFIKMDIEGAELEAIKGAWRTLKNNNVFLAIASYHVVKGQKTCFEVEKIFYDLGYKAETSYARHLVTYASKL